jgi:ferric-dicitrate binding protein FerR (iron transport regulator)
LATTARRLESAWQALTEAAQREQERWKAEIDRVRGWRRSVWPLWAITAAVLLVLTYLGLVLGGYIPGPRFLQGLADFWWSRP